MAVANQQQGSNFTTVSIALGNGDGTFQTVMNFLAGNLLTSIAAGDFNGDGKPDLAVANNTFNSNDVLVLTNSTP